ncbi:MAG TPA: YbaK/EbsC family protein, partial [Dehalococcoidia bacterium]|nr:YbaK/EbsC family protein [Dehalococcoidia bacterium]
MKQRIDKTNAVRLLDARKVRYEVLTYDPEIHSAGGAAAALGLEPRQVYKTLVALPEGRTARSRPLLVMVAGDRELEPRRLARSVGL